MADNYYVLQDGEKTGPFTFKELVDMGLDINTRVAPAADSTWQNASDVPEFQDYFEIQGYLFPTEANLASFWWRLLAYVIDSIIIAFVMMIFTPQLFLNVYKNQLANDISTAALLDRLTLNMVAFLFSTIYSSILEATQMRGSLGKKICRLAVVDADGRKLTFLNALGRNLGKFLSNLVLGVGYLNILWDEHRQAWHDQFAKTYVIKRS